MVWGQIAGAAIGALASRNAAKKQQQATQDAIAAQMAGFNLAKPYISDMYKGGKTALDAALNAGYYGGQTYAGLNQAQQDGLDTLETTGRDAAIDAANFMSGGRGFATNAQNLYGQASQNMLNNAINYASTNVNPLLTAATRGAYNNLTQNLLPSNAQSASATGNTNSSLKAVENARLKNAFLDRQADVATNIQNQLIDRSLNEQQSQLNNMTDANKNLAALYQMGVSGGADAADMMMRSGEGYRTDQQNQLDDTRANFEGNRDYALDQYMKFNAGILNNAPQSVGQVQPNLVSPTAATLGGAMQGFGFGGKYLNNLFTSPSSSGGGGNVGSSYGNFMTLPQQQNYFGQMNFGGNNLI